MRQIFTYPLNLATDYVDPDYVGNSTSGLTRRIDELLTGTYKAWTGLDPISDLSTTTSEAMQNLSKFKNYENSIAYGSHISRYDFWNNPVVVATRGPIAGQAPISSADVLNPATITTAAPHEFIDGQRVQITGFDGTWGLEYNGDEFYCKRISATELQCSFNETLTSLVGFQTQITPSFINDELSYEYAISSAVQINFASAGINPPDNSQITFDTINNQGASLIGNTYYLKSTGTGNYYQIFKDQDTLVDPVMMTDIAPLPTETPISFIGGSPIKVVTASQLSANDLEVYVNVPKQWNDEIYHWNSDQIYYLKTTANVLEYEVYTDSAYTLPVNITNWTPVAPLGTSYPNIDATWMFLLASGAAEPDPAYPSNAQPSDGVLCLIHQDKTIIDGDSISVGTVPAGQEYNGTESLENTTYYLKYRDNESIRTDYKTYEVYEDLALTNRLTTADLTMGSYTKTIDIEDNNPYFTSTAPSNAGILDNYQVGLKVTKTILQENNTDFNLSIGDDLDWYPVLDSGNPGFDRNIAELAPPGTNIMWSNELTMPEPAISPLPHYGDSSITTFNNASFWTDVDTFPRIFDPDMQSNTFVKAQITSVEKNGQNLIGDTVYISSSGYISTTDLRQSSFRAGGETLPTSTPINITDFSDWQFANNTLSTTNPARVQTDGSLTTNDYKVAIMTSAGYASGNTPAGLPFGQTNRWSLYPTATAGEFEIKYLTAADNLEDLDLTGPWETTYTPSSGYGLYSDLDDTYVQLNSTAYPLNTTDTLITAGNYVTASTIFDNKLTLANHIGDSWYRLVDQNNDSVTVTDWDVTDLSHDVDYELVYDNAKYRIAAQNGSYPTKDIAIKFRNTTDNATVVDIISDLAVDTPYVWGTDGVLYTDNTKITPVIQQFDKVNIDEMVNTSPLGFFPEASTSNNRVYTSVVQDDGNNIVLNDPTNAYYGSFTLDDYTALDLDIGQIAIVNGVSSLPFDLVKFVAGGSINNSTTPTNTGPIQIQTLNDGTNFYTLNGKKLYQFVNWDGLFGTNLDDSSTITYNTTDEGYTYSGSGTYADYTPYLFKTYQQYGVFQADKSPGSVVGIKVPITLGTAEWLFMQTDGWDTGVTAPATDTIRSVYTLPGTLTSMIENSAGIQQFPNVNTRATEVTGVNFIDIFGFSCPINTLPESSTSTAGYRDYNEGWEYYSNYYQNVRISADATNTGTKRGGTGYFANGSTITTVDKFTIPKLAKYTISNLPEIRSWRTNDTTLSDTKRITVTVDDGITGNNPYYEYFNTGDIIEGQNSVKYIMVKNHNSGSWITTSDDIWETDAIQGSNGWFFDIDDYYGSNKTSTWVEAEEWFLIRLYENGTPNNERFNDIVGIKEGILDNYVEANIPGGTPPGTNSGVWLMKGNDPFLNQSGNGWKLLAENIATQAPQAITDPVYDVVTPEADFQLTYSADLRSVPFIGNSAGDATTATSITDETFNPVTLASTNMGDVTFKRYSWHMDSMSVKPWLFGSVYYQTSQPNNPKGTNASNMSSIYTGGGTATVGLAGLTDSTTGTVSLGPSQPNPYKITGYDIVLPGNKIYSYKDTNNITQFGAEVDWSTWWEAGAIAESELSDFADQIAADYSINVDANGRLASVGAATETGRYNNGTDMVWSIQSLPDTYVPPVVTPAELQDVYNTHDEWLSDGYADGLKQWPDHITPASATIAYAQPTIVNNSQNGFKYARSSGFTKWVLDVEYPPMTADDFSVFSGIAQAAHGQATPFYFNLQNKDGEPILWRDWKDSLSATEAIYIESAEPGDTLLFVEGLTSDDANAFRPGEVFISSENQNGSIHSALSNATSNVFGEAKVRLPYPLRQGVSQSDKLYKDPSHVVVTMASDAFEYSVDVNGYYYVSVKFDLDGWK